MNTAGFDPVLWLGLLTLWRANPSISVSLSFVLYQEGPAFIPASGFVRPLDTSANSWVTNARSGGNLHEPGANGGRTDQPWRTGLRYFLAPLEGAHRLRDRGGRGWDVDADRRPAFVSRSGESEKGNLDVHQFARRGGDIGTCDLRHHAIHPPAGFDPVYGAGGLDGLAAACCRREGHALFAAELANHGASALRRLPGPGHRHHAARAGDPEPQEAAQ